MREGRWEGRKKLGAREGPGAREGGCEMGVMRVGLEGLHKGRGRESRNERDGKTREDASERREDGRERRRERRYVNCEVKGVEVEKRKARGARGRGMRRNGEGGEDEGEGGICVGKPTKTLRTALVPLVSSATTRLTTPAFTCASACECVSRWSAACMRNNIERDEKQRKSRARVGDRL
jgi:hypothetical protein